MKCVIIVLWYASSELRSVESACSNACSGHGSCTIGNVCKCYAGWNGGAADCSFRECPQGPAWADKAYAVDLAHQPVECSNSGICNRVTGLCSCFNGFTGNGCQRSSCPNDCSGKGTCLTIKDISRFDGPSYNNMITQSGDGLGLRYTNWDANSLTACSCDGGFFGADCSLAMCPKGDDPLTVNQNYREILLTVQSSSASLSGSLGVEFLGQRSILSLSNPSGPNCIKGLEQSDFITSVNCTFMMASSNRYLYNITFIKFPTFTKENNFHTNDGNPLVTDFYCDGSLASSGVTCVFTDVVNTGLREYAYCSNRGICDFTNGFCSCNTGFGGSACGEITYLYSEGSNALPGLQVNVNGLDYISTALQIRSTKPPADDFFLINAVAGGQGIFSVRGDGLVGISQLNLRSGLTITGSGLIVVSGGVTVDDGGLNVVSSISAQKATVASVTSTFSGTLPSTVTVLAVSSLSSSVASQHLLFSAINQGDRKFTIRADGFTTIFKGGLSVSSGGVTVAANGMSVSGGVTVTNGGLTVTGGVTTLTGGIFVSAAGITVNNGGLIITAGGGKIYSGGLQVTGGCTLNSGGLVVNAAGISVLAGGLRVTGGLSVNTGGLVVTAGGLSVVAGGIHATDGVTVSNTGLRVAGGGIQATGGLTVSDGGLSVSGGLYITGGLTIEGGLTVLNSGAIFPSPFVTSDRRLKTDVIPLENALSKVTKLRGVYFRWIEDEASGLTFDEDRHVGLMAQDVQQVLPEVVHPIHGGRFLSVDYTSLVPLLIEATRELDEKTTVASKNSMSICQKLESRLASLEDGQGRERKLKMEPQERELTEVVLEKLAEENRVLRNSFDTLLADYKNLKDDFKNLKKDSDRRLQAIEDDRHRIGTGQTRKGSSSFQ